MVEELQTAEENQKEKVSNDRVLDVDIDAVQVMETVSDLDVSGYEGFRIPIDSVEVIETINWYNKLSADGTSFVYNPESTEKMQKVRIKTSPLPVLDENGKPTEELVSIGEDKKLEVQARFNLSQIDGKWVISKHPKAKLWAFMRKLNAEKLSDMKEQFVTLTTEPSKTDDKVYLRIVT
jgi:hypothetical protein